MDGRKKTKGKVYGKKGDSLLTGFAALGLSASPPPPSPRKAESQNLRSEKTEITSSTKLAIGLGNIYGTALHPTSSNLPEPQPQLSLGSWIAAANKSQFHSQASPKESNESNRTSRLQDACSDHPSFQDPISLKALQTLQLEPFKDSSKLPNSLHHSKNVNSPISSVDKSSSFRDSNKLALPELIKSSASTNPSLKPQFERHPAPVDKSTAIYVEPLTFLYPGIESFEGWLAERLKLFTIQKVGEGSYGEVYRASDSTDQTAIFKLIPLRPMKGPGSRSRTPIKDAVNEVKLLEKMSQVPGFVEFRGACILRGTMSVQLVEQWNAYKATDRSVETDDPNKKRTYPSTQLWLALEMSDAGTDLSHYEPLIAMPGFVPPHRSWDIFWQTVKALAKAEIHAEFEHRDLHMGNICIDTTTSRILEGDAKLVSCDSPTPFPFDGTGVEVTIIDYSLARARISEDLVLFNDLEEDGGMFENGHKNNTYNRMLEAVGSGKWNEYRPETNVMWLSHLLRALLQRSLKPKVRGDPKKGNGDQISVEEKMLMIMHEMEDMISKKNWRAWGLKSARDILDAGLTKEWFTVEALVG